MPKKIITVSVISELTTDQRVIRICTTLQEMGFEVKVVARSFSDSLPLGNYNFQAKRIHCYFTKGFLQYAEFNIKIFIHLLFRKSDYFLANDLDTLLPNFLVSKLRKKSIFYDTHEYFTGVPELENAKLKKRIWKLIEDNIFPKLPIVYTVNDSVKKQYSFEYGKENIRVIRNVPKKISYTIPAIPNEWIGKKILLLQGMGMHTGRGANEFLQMLQFLPSEYHGVLIGGGQVWSELQHMVKSMDLHDRITFIPKVPPETLRGYTSLAQVGFSLDKPIALNNKLSLPNKIFDYIQAGVPVAATPIPEVKKIIEQYRCGFCFTSMNPEQMANEVMDLMKDKNRYKMYKENAILAAKELCWEVESEKLIEIYKPFL